MNHAIPAIDTVRDYLTGLRDRICAAIEAADGHARFVEMRGAAPTTMRAPTCGGGRTCVLRDGAVFEQAGIGFSDVSGTRLPPSATAARPELVGASWRRGRRLAGVPPAQSLPADHARERAPFPRRARWRDRSLVVRRRFDLTPFYPFDEDVRHWHRTARDLCGPFGDGRATPRTSADATSISSSSTATRRAASAACSSTTCKATSIADFGYLRAVGDGFLDAYLPIVERRKDHAA